MGDPFRAGSNGHHPGFHGGSLGQPAGIQYARILIDLYWMMSEANQEYSTQRNKLLAQKADLIAHLTDPSSVDGALATSKYMAAIEMINQEIRYLDAGYLCKKTVFDSLPILLRAESVLPVQSRRDIALANILRQYYGWVGAVRLIPGGPDLWQTCMQDIAGFGLPLW